MIRMKNLDVLSGLDDPALPPPPHNLRAHQQPVAADVNANANDDQDDEDDDSDFVPGLCDDSDDEADIGSDDEEDDSDEENNLPRPIKLDVIFLEKLRFRQVKPDTKRKIVSAALTGMKTAVECRLHPNSR